MFPSRTLRFVVPVLFLCIVTVGIADAHWTGQLHSHFTTPTYQFNPPTTYRPVPRQESLVPTYQAPNYQLPQRQPQVDWRDFTRDFHMPEHHQRDLERGDRLGQRYRITIPGCHRYNRACLNELRSLGR